MTGELHMERSILAAVALPEVGAVLQFQDGSVAFYEEGKLHSERLAFSAFPAPCPSMCPVPPDAFPGAGKVSTASCSSSDVK